MGGIGDMFGGGGDDAAEASIEASEIQAQYQREALEYLKEREAVPQAYREAALEQMGAEYGLTLDEEGRVISGDALTPLERARQSPLYEALLGGREAGEEAIMRRQAATGGLRSGTTQEALYDYNVQLENQALLESYNQQMQGLQGLAGLPSLAPAIAQGTSNIGQTLAQGQVAAAQAQAAGQQQGFGNLMGAGQLAMQAYSTFSDIRLKDNIEPVGRMGPYTWYRWDWNEEAANLGLQGESEGVMAHEVFEIQPESIGTSEGYITVDYNNLRVA